MGYSVNSVNSDDTERIEGHASSLIYDRVGNRKYLTLSERNAFLAAASTVDPGIYSFCLVLAYSGARISEVLALSRSRVDGGARVVVFESLKKRRRGVFRAVPMPARLIERLRQVHQLDDHPRPRERLWPWSRTTAWKRVRELMRAAGVPVPQGTPKGLRHGFAVAALQSGVPINLVRKWLGHARLSTTEIYADAVGPEEQAIAERFWDTF